MHLPLRPFRVSASSAPRSPADPRAKPDVRESSSGVASELGQEVTVKRTYFECGTDGPVKSHSHQLDVRPSMAAARPEKFAAYPLEGDAGRSAASFAQCKDGALLHTVEHRHLLRVLGLPSSGTWSSQESESPTRLGQGLLETRVSAPSTSAPGLERRKLLRYTRNPPGDVGHIQW